MKKWCKTIGALICGATMLFSAAGTVFSAESTDVDLQTVYQMAQKALDQQAIQNVMTHHVMYHCYGEHQEEMEELWVQEPENQATASFAQNQGYYVGYAAIWEAYVDGHTESWLSSAKSYIESNNIDVTGWTDEEILEVYGGVGQLLLHCTTTGCIEVAEDGQTAKAFWYSPGLVKETGQTGSTIWEAYGVDFVKENGEWKIWHLHMYTDFVGSFYITLGGSGSGGGQGSGQAAQDASSEGEAPDGDSQGGVAPDGEAPDGDSQGGEAPDGMAPDGTAPDGESAPAEDAAASEDASEETADNSSTEWVPEGGEQIALENADPNEYLSRSTYSTLTDSRLREDMELIIPTPYETWSFDEANYGPTAQDYEDYGIDLDAWYEAHA